MHKVLSRVMIAILVASIAANIVFIAFEAATGGLENALKRNHFSLLGSRIFVENPNDIIINFTALRGEIRALVDRREDLRVGLYFEYLPSGVSIGINEKEPFVSASLLKAPFIMGIFRRLEQGFLREDAILTLHEKDIDPSFGALWKEGEGFQLTVADAIRRALVDSDNTAVRVLDELMVDDLVVEVYEALDIPVEHDENFVVTTPKNYASVFRCLYLSCFLQFAGSQRMLSLLTQSQFRDGIPEGIPSDVPFAHKVGIFDPPGSDRVLRLDCGIAYVPRRPYLLCVFVEGDKKRLREVYAFARELSAKIYRYVSEAKDFTHAKF